MESNLYETLELAFNNGTLIYKNPVRCEDGQIEVISAYTARLSQNGRGCHPQFEKSEMIFHPN